MLITVQYRPAGAQPEPYELQVEAPSRFETDLDVARRITAALHEASQRRRMVIGLANHEALVARITSWVAGKSRPALERGQTRDVIEYTAIEEPAVDRSSRSVVPPRPPPMRASDDGPPPGAGLWGDTDG